MGNGELGIGNGELGMGLPFDYAVPERSRKAGTAKRKDWHKKLKKIE